jgi:hypothetical protein
LGFIEQIVADQFDFYRHDAVKISTELDPQNAEQITYAQQKENHWIIPWTFVGYRSYFGRL